MVDVKLPRIIDPAAVADFLKQESAGGLLLMAAAALAMVIANSPLYNYYSLLLDTRVMVAVGTFEIAKPLLLWVNDGLMAVFFLLVGLELKREVVEGELSELRVVVFPALGALGGMLVPALVFVSLNLQDKVALQGWAIPAATDIAFALGVLMLLGPRVPTSIKIFLTSLAIFDDIGAIVVIALFYTSNLSATALVVAAGSILSLWYLNKRGVAVLSPYLIVGAVMWVAVLKSGVHATLAGVILALFIPLRSPTDETVRPLKTLEHDLHTAVAFFILPVFAFCNAGINFVGVGFAQLLHPVPLGIALGLFLGKQIGVFGLCWLGVKLKWATLPEGMSWLSLYGVALLCGIGFTMSLFISSLAFDPSTSTFDERLGIVFGSLLSGVVGYLVLRASLPEEAVS